MNGSQQLGGVGHDTKIIRLIRWSSCIMPGTEGFSDEERSGLYKAILARRDVRSGFLRRGVPSGVLARILNAAHHAPSVGFSQPWNFILIRDRSTRGRIKRSFDEERMRAAGRVEESRRTKYLSLKLEGILDSPLNICVTFDPTRFGPFVIGRNSIPETGVYSVCCAVQNLWLAARTEGIGVGWVSILSNDVLRETLGLPDHVLPVAYLCLGYVREFANSPDLEAAGWLPRLGLSDVVHYEDWEGRTDPRWSEIREILKSGT